MSSCVCVCVCEYLSPAAGNQKIKTLVCDVMLIYIPVLLSSQLIRD